METNLVTGSSLSIPIIDIGQLQENLIISHGPGAGVPLPPEFVQAMMGNGFCTETFKKHSAWSGTMRG